MLTVILYLTALITHQVAAHGATYQAQISRLLGPIIRDPNWSTIYYSTDAWDNSKDRYLLIQYWTETISCLTLEVAEELENGTSKDPPTMSEPITLLPGLNEIFVTLHSTYHSLHSLRSVKWSPLLHYAYKISILNPKRDDFHAFSVISIDVIDRSPSSSRKIPYISVYNLHLLRKQKLLNKLLQTETECGIVAPLSKNSPIKGMEWLRNLDPRHFRENVNIWFSVTGITPGIFSWISQKIAPPIQQQPRTDFFLWVAQKITHPSLDLFAVSKIANNALYIHKECAPDRLDYYKAVGRIIGLAILNRKLSGMSFVPSIQKLILKQPIEPLDLKYVDPEKYDELESFLNNELPKKPPVWAVTYNNVQVNLIPNGRSISVTEQSKFRYVDAFCLWYLKDRIWKQIKAMQEGLFEVVPLKYISIFRADELKSVIHSEFLVEWIFHTGYIECRRSDMLIQWFWQCMWSWVNERRVKLLLYVTKTSDAPLKGFAKSRNLFSSDIWFNIEVKMFEHAISRGDSNTLNLPGFISTYQALVDELEVFIRKLETEHNSQDSDNKVDILYQDMELDRKASKSQVLF